MHTVPGIKVLYFGTPVVLVSTLNEDGSANLAPMSSAFWLHDRAFLGFGAAGHTVANLLRTGECVLNMPSSDQVAHVDRIAMTTGADPVPQRKADMGYVHVRDKFALAGLTEQESELVAPPRALELPIQMECRLVRSHFAGEDARLITFELEVLRTHVEEKLVLPGTHYIDPEAWDPLIMKFTEFFGGGHNVHASRLAEHWEMPHRLRPAGEPADLAAAGAGLSASASA